MNLLRQIEIYLADNNINRTNFGKHVMRDGGFITRVMATGEANMRQRTIDKCRQFMMDNPNADGIPKIQQKPSLGRKRNRSTNHIGLKSLSPGFNRIDTNSLVRVNRTPCWRCGVRGDVGCFHHPLEILI